MVSSVGGRSAWADRRHAVGRLRRVARVGALAACLLAGCGTPLGTSPDATGESLEELYGGPVRADGLPVDPTILPTRFGVRVSDDGTPVDPAFQPGPAGIPEALRDMLLRVRARRAEAPLGPHERSHGWATDPTLGPDGRFVMVPEADLLVGAQATDPSGRGYDPDAAPNEGPPRPVHVGAFLIQAREVEAGAVADCLATGACELDAGVPDDVRESLQHPPRRMAPARNVTWREADQVCASLSASLPTEEQWELAARGTDGRRWPWGAVAACGVPEALDGAPDAPDDARPAPMQTPPCGADGAPRTVRRAVGKSPYGLEGMAGGVAEWTRGDGAHATSHVARGGGWLSTDPRDLRTTSRVPIAATTRLPDVGFRCVWGREYVD